MKDVLVDADGYVRDDQSRLKRNRYGMGAPVAAR